LPTPLAPHYRDRQADAACPPLNEARALLSES